MIKSGEVKRDKDGIWTVSDKSGQSYPSSTGPFSQTENAMHKIIKTVKNIFGKDSNKSMLLISHGVIFTSTPFAIEDPEIEKWRICNCRDIEEAEKNEEGFLNYL
jgi:hypothetical protein